MFLIFQKFPNLVTAISSKIDDLDRTAFLNKHGIDSKQVVRANLVHGNNVSVVNNKDISTVVQETDGLITNTKNIFLAITVADCLPIFYFDSNKQVIALTHAGWRGVLKAIPAITVQKMEKAFHCNSADIFVGIGPHICGQYYEVKSDVSQKFSNYGDRVVIQKNGLQFLDLAEAVRIQLIQQGINEKNIEVSSDCTFEQKDKYFSYRRDKSKKLKTMITVIGLKHKSLWQKLKF